MLTRLGGQPMALNPDLIEKAEATPDTVITMVDGHKLVVAEPVGEVVDRIRSWRASVAIEAFTLSAPATPGQDAPGQSAVNGISPLAQVLRMPAREEQ
jgi:flagellar protein FlbD